MGSICSKPRGSPPVLLSLTFTTLIFVFCCSSLPTSLISQEHSPCSSAIVTVENRFEFSYGETFPSFTFHSLNKHLSNAFQCQVPKVAKRIGQSLPSKTQHLGGWSHCYRNLYCVLWEAWLSYPRFQGQFNALNKKTGPNFDVLIVSIILKDDTFLDICININNFPY